MNIGDYVRSEEGFIAKITDIKELCGNKVANFDKYIDGAILEIEDTYIVGMLLENMENLKHSTNIIDLIQVGDYVNGNRVIKNCIENKGNIVLFENGYCARNEEIKSIVTKEQFERNEYKI